jgi:hypothetical protein
MISGNKIVLLNIVIMLLSLSYLFELVRVLYATISAFSVGIDGTVIINTKQL